tara:strand:+ start:11246 stop:11392 length:147 start_codon:yes stop_codon:yes gene_type:complete
MPFRLRRERKRWLREICINGVLIPGREMLFGLFLRILLSSFDQLFGLL